MKVLFLDQFSQMGGAQMCLVDLLPAIRQRGWSGVVLAPGDGALHAAARDAGFRSASLPLSSYTNSRKTAADAGRFAIDILRTRRVVRRVIREEEPDLIYLNGPRAAPAASNQGLPVLFHSHSALDKRYAKWIIKQSLGRGHSRTIACSEFLARPLRELLGEERVHVVPNGVADLEGGQRSLDSAKCVVGMIGRLAPEKGHLDFMEAARRLSDAEGVRFVVIGEDRFSAPGFAASVKELGDSLGVDFLGWLSPKEAFGKIDVLAAPSAPLEASGRVVMEAFSAGAVVVAYNSGGIPELVRHGVNGILCERNAGSLADALRVVTTDPQLRERLKEGGRQTYLARFTLERYQDEICDDLAEWIEARKPSSTERRYRAKRAGLVGGGRSA